MTLLNIRMQEAVWKGEITEDVLVTSDCAHNTTTFIFMWAEHKHIIIK
jgi:hypothetical protein